MPPDRFRDVLLWFSTGSNGSYRCSSFDNIEDKIPFINFFDGFRTSHEYHKIEVMDQEDIAKLVDMDDVKRFRDRALTPERPQTRGTAENPETFFTHREACNAAYDKVPEVVEKYLGEISQITGREYHLFSYYGAADAENIIILMGSATEAAREAIDYLDKAGQEGGHDQRSPLSSVLS